MKTVLKFSGIIAFVLAVVAFILMMATTSVVYTTNVNVPGIGSGSHSSTASGIVGIFGGTDAGYAAPWAGLIAWILIIVALLILCSAIVLPLLKVKALDKFAGLLNLVAVIALVVAGVFMFLEVTAWTAANGDGSYSLGSALNGSYSLGAGWVIAGIISIVAGVVAVLPAAADFLDKK